MASRLLAITLFLMCAVLVFSVAAIWVDWAVPAALVSNALLWPIVLAMIGVIGGKLEEFGLFMEKTDEL